MVFRWRRQLATGTLGEAASHLVPVTAAPTISFGGVIEIPLASATMRIEAPDPATLTMVLKELRP